ELATTKRCRRRNAMHEYRATGHTRVAPKTESQKATFVMLKNAKKTRAKGKKKRRMMNSVCLPANNNRFERRLSTCSCQICNNCSGRSDASTYRCRATVRKLATAPIKSTAPPTKYALEPDVLSNPSVNPTKRNR